ncbi:C40 family peptidase [Cohnella kolymensis]|uniref:C40 family peptidase n=1 Tax=Cohnella kolymensis TaxID=1590652 RepID=UPI0009E44022
MRKWSVALISLALLLTFQAGSAFADSKLDTTVGKLIGIGYDYGGTTKSGFDCSGFTGYVFKQLGVNLPRTSRDQATRGMKVARDELRPGDLVFFNTSGRGISHVGIYVGDGNFAHSSSRKGVTISGLGDSYYSKRFVTARRVMDANTYLKVATEPKVVLAANSETAPQDTEAALKTDVAVQSDAAAPETAVQAPEVASATD